ncbi:MAG: Na(+)-translocating NADH-quinone reductase subunit A [Bacteroidales bacterium]|nr:Na(+)-translocating NADH-quinone reductase subunit A [Bacteroidales bacterium]
MAKVIKIRRGLNIRLKGKAEKIFIRADQADYYAVKPTDFPGLTPKLNIKEEDLVKAGSPLFHDKYNPEITFSSPVSGKVKEILRGERRQILEVIVEADKEIEYLPFEKADPLKLSREEIIENLLVSGMWPFIRQRPYAIVANPKDTPKSIFISAYNSAPLAPDNDFVVKDGDKDFQIGIDALSKLTNGKIHLNLDATYPASRVYTQAKRVQTNYFKGPHPAGNVGVHIHHIDPINKGEVVWYINPQDVISIGRLFDSGKYDVSKVIALTGSEVKKPRYFRIIGGCSIAKLIEDNVNDGNLRYISGNVLTGTKINSDGFVGFYDSQLTVIPEGDHYEFIGWAKPGFKKFSASRTFWSWMAPGKKYRLDTNLNGGERAFVLTGFYEKVFPFNIYPMQLLKAILIEDVELMEKLGIYEVAEEDFALCEFVDPSKTEMQALIRKGIDLMIKEMS